MLYTTRTWICETFWGKNIASHDVQPSKKNTIKSHQVLRIPVGWCWPSCLPRFPATISLHSKWRAPLGLQTHSAAPQGHYPWTSRNQGNQRAKKTHRQKTWHHKRRCVKKKHPQPHTPKKNMIEKWVLIKSSKFSPHFSTFLACYGMCLNVWFHPTTPFFALRECVVFFCQSIHTATGRPCRRAPQTKVGEHHAYQVERQQAAIPLSMSVVWRSILKQFMSFIMVCLEKEALLSSHTVTFPFSSWFYGGSFCIHTSSPHGNWDHPPSARTIM